MRQQEVYCEHCAARAETVARALAIYRRLRAEAWGDLRAATERRAVVSALPLPIEPPPWY